MSAADRNLLLGVVALQVDLIDRDALIRAMQAWVQDKSRTLAEILVAQGDLNERQAELLENLAHEHVQRHGGVAASGLAALSSIGTVRSALGQLADSEVQASLAHTASAPGVTPTAEATRSPQTTMPDPVRSRFRILRMHARGGLGRVFVAEDAELHRNVALKEIDGRIADEPLNRERFLVEAEITGRLQHPGVVPVYGLGTYADGRPFYAMRFIEGDNLLTAIRRFHHQAGDRPWQGEQLVAFRELLSRFTDVCDAMQFAHERHVLHRDLKPHNIMLGEYGETLVVDWGLAKPLYEGRLTEEVPEGAIVPRSGSTSGGEGDGSVLGTVEYMPPEQAAGKLSQLTCRSDVYSLGATLYHLLTGQPPFQIDGGATDEGVARDQLLERVKAGEFAEPRAVNPRVPRGLNAICMRAMAMKSDERYASARDLKHEIQRWLADEPVQAVPEAWYERAGRWFRHHRVVTLVAASALVLIAVLATASAVLIDRYRRGQLREARINQLSTELERHTDEAVEVDLPMGEKFFGQVDPLLDELARLAPAAAARREQEALEAAAESIERHLTRSTPSKDLLATLRDQIDLWSGRRQRAHAAAVLVPREAELRDLLKNRQAPWNALDELSGTQLVRTLDGSDGIITDALGTLRAAPKGERHQFLQFTLSQLPADLDHEIEVRFHPDSLAEPAVAVGLSPQNDRPAIHQYQAVLCVDGFAPGQWTPARLRRLPSLRDAVNRGEAVRLLLCRGRTLLNEARLNIGLQSFRLLARREDDRLFASLSSRGGASAQVEFRDFLPLSSGNRPGLWMGPSTAIEAVTLGFRARPIEHTELEQIKLLIASGRLDEARRLLEPRTDRLSIYLRSRCLTQPSERLDLLDRLLDQPPQIDRNGVVADAWHLPALLDAIELNDQNPERFRELVSELVLFYRTSLDDITARVPQDLREKLVSEYRKLGGRWRVAVQPSPDDVAMLDVAVQLDKMLEPDPAIRRATRWRRCDVWRVADRVQEASDELQQLLDEALADPGAEPGEAAALLSDLCWLFFARQQLSEAETLLQELGARPSLPKFVEAAIELESARLSIHQNRWDAAAERLAALLREADRDRMRPVQHADACLLAGFVEHERGNRAAGEAIWRRGRHFDGQRPTLRRRDAASLQGTQMVEHQLTVICDGTLGSLLNAFTEEEAHASFDAQIPEGGVTGAAGRVIVKTGFESGLLRDLANGLYRSPAGKEVAKNMTFRSYTFREYFAEPIQLMIFEGVMLRGFHEFRSDPAFVADVQAACEDFFRTYDVGGINEQDDMRLIVALWSGEAGLETWQRLEQKLNPGVAAGLALVAGRSQLLAAETAASDRTKESHRRTARALLELARDHPAAADSFQSVAGQFLEDLSQ